MIGVNLSALLSSATSCILEYPTIINICDTEWKSENSELGDVGLSFKCYDNGKYVFLTHLDGSREMGYWEDRTIDSCCYNIHLITRNSSTNEEIQIITGEIASDATTTMTITWHNTSTPTILHTSAFIRLK